jgi:Zn-dependent oligopeptidase
MEVNQVIDSATPQVENRVATLADLRAVLDSVREEIAILRNPSTEPQFEQVTEEARREIHSLQQEIV